MVVDNLGDHEVEPLLGERGIQMAINGERPQPGDLHFLSFRIGRRKSTPGFHSAHLLSEPESLSKEVNERCIDVVDA